MFSKLTNAIVANQDTIVRKSLGLGSIAAGMAINSMLNKPKGPKTVVVVEEATITVEETTNTEEPETNEAK